MDQHLITVDELRAAGALDVPPAWRKSLASRPVQRDLFSNLPADDDSLPETEQESPAEPDDDEFADESA